MTVIDENPIHTLPTPDESLEIDDARDDLSWQQDALCTQTDPEMFFPEKGGSPADAKRVCDGCDVRERCLQYALDNNERFGVWGGKTKSERDQLRATEKPGRSVSPHKRLTGQAKKARDQRIILLAKSTSAKAIAVEFGISERSVHRVLAHARKLDEEQVELKKSA
jgi:WhiB family redox-sensing transcriptional regulator